MINRRRLVTGALAGAAAPLSIVEPAFAQLAGNAFIISGFPAGGMGDLVSRPLAERMRGSYAAKCWSKARSAPAAASRWNSSSAPAPDGLTILQIPASIMALYPHIYKKLAYDPLADFVPVTTTGTYAYSFTASSALAGRDHARSPTSSPGRGPIRSSSSYGIPAAGSALHFAGMMLQRATGIEFTAVPYRGGAPLLTDMLGGVVPVSFNVLGEVLPHIRSGKLRSLGVMQRRSGRRSCPTCRPWSSRASRTSRCTEWLGWFLPAKTPADIVQPAERARARGTAVARDGREPRQLGARAATPDAGGIRRAC